MNSLRCKVKGCKLGIQYCLVVWRDLNPVVWRDLNFCAHSTRQLWKFCCAFDQLYLELKTNNNQQCFGFQFQMLITSCQIFTLLPLLFIKSMGLYHTIRKSSLADAKRKQKTFGNLVICQNWNHSLVLKLSFCEKTFQN